MKKELIEKQMITTIIFILSLLVSLLITYNELLKLDKKEFLSDSISKRIVIINKLLVAFLSLSYLYINYKFDKINPSRNSKLQIIASAITFGATLIVLYVVLDSNNIITNIENPDA